MPRAILFTTIGCGVFVVFGLDVRISHRAGFLEIGEQLADQQGLACQFHLDCVVLGRIQALLLGFLNKNLAGDHFIAQLALHFRRHRAARLGDLLSQCLDTRDGHGFAVHDGDVLGQRQWGQAANEQGADQG